MVRQYDATESLWEEFKNFSLGSHVAMYLNHNFLAKRGLSFQDVAFSSNKFKIECYLGKGKKGKNKLQDEAKLHYHCSLISINPS